MKSLKKGQQLLLILTLVATLVALYVNNNQLNYAISVALILVVLLISISLVTSYQKSPVEERSAGFNSRLAVTVLIVLCALISIYLISVSSEPLFSESARPMQALELAKMTPLIAIGLP